MKFVKRDDRIVVNVCAGPREKCCHVANRSVVRPGNFWHIFPDDSFNAIYHRVQSVKCA